MNRLLVTFAIVLALGITSMVTKIVYFANIAGFIASIGFLFLFFQDKSHTDSKINKLRRRNWYVVFLIGIIFAIFSGSMWNSNMGNL